MTFEQAEDPKREEIYGNNRTIEREGVTYCQLVWEGMHDFTLILLSIAAVISIALGVYTEGWDDGWYDGFVIIIAVAVCVNVTAINDLQKDKQFRALNAVNNAKQIRTLRGGEMVLVKTDDIVVGDIVEITAGDSVPADGYFLNGSNVKMDESKLTGESDQVEKNESNPFEVKTMPESAFRRSFSCCRPQQSKNSSSNTMRRRACATSSLVFGR